MPARRFFGGKLAVSYYGNLRQYRRGFQTKKMNKIIHYTFSTYKRRHILTNEVIGKLEGIFEDICRIKGLKLIHQSILVDHVHLLFVKNQLDRNEYVMKMIKGISSHLIFKKYPTNRIIFRKLWSRGYRAREIKETEHLENAISYISRQKINNIDKRAMPDWKPRQLVPTLCRDLVAGLLMLIMILFLSSCSPSAEKADPVLISTPSEEAQEAEPPKREIVSSYESLRGNSKEPKLESKVIYIKNISPDKAVETISRAIPNIIAVKNEESNSMVIRGEADEMAEAQKIINAIDKKIPQILIEGKVVEVSQSGLEDISVIWGKEQGSFKFSIDKNTGGISQSDDILGTINMLIASGKANILANPKITALDGKEAEINIGSRIPYAVPAGTSSTATQWTVQYIDAGVNLKILPNVASDGTIVSTIKPEVSNVSEWRTTTAGEFPVISTRNASVTVRIRDGETLVIGGLINEFDRENVSRIPVLSDVPVFGQLFQRKVSERSKSEVIFLITPHLMD